MITEPQTLTLAAFLLARLDDDEAVAREAVDTSPYRDLCGSCGHLHSDPARVLADVEAKRKLLDLHEGEHDCMECLDAWDEGTTEGRVYGGSVAAGSMVRDGVRLAGCQTIRLLALPYAGHPAWREEWRP